MLVVKPAYIAHSGKIANSGGILSLTNRVTADQPIVGRSLSDVDEDGYAKVYIDLPGNTNA